MKHWLAHWPCKQPPLSVQQRQRLDAWAQMPRAALATPLDSARCVVVDVETSGLDLRKDRLISIGAVAMVQGKIALGDSFSVVLQQPAASRKDNILLHGIGGTAQTEGDLPSDALLDFLEYLGKDPLVAFHAHFDQAMIQRALRDHLGLAFRHDWLDLAYLMPALNPALAASLRSLDDWSAHFDIGNDERHHALADALATAQLLQVALAQARKKNITDFTALLDLEKAQRWINDIA